MVVVSCSILLWKVELKHEMRPWGLYVLYTLEPVTWHVNHHEVLKGSTTSCSKSSKFGVRAAEAIKKPEQPIFCNVSS